MWSAQPSDGYIYIYIYMEKVITKVINMMSAFFFEKYKF